MECRVKLWSLSYHQLAAQKGVVTCLRSHKFMAKWGLAFAVQQHRPKQACSLAWPSDLFSYCTSYSLHPLLSYSRCNLKVKCMHDCPQANKQYTIPTLYSVISKSKWHVYGGEWREKPLSWSDYLLTVSSCPTPCHIHSTLAFIPQIFTGTLITVLPIAWENPRLVGKLCLQGA